MTKRSENDKFTKYGRLYTRGHIIRLDELFSIVRRLSRRIRLPKLVQTDNASSSIKNSI